MATTELLNDPAHIRQDLRLMEQAIKANPIEIPQAIIDAMPKVAGRLLVEGKPREKLAAGRLLLAYMEFNQRVKESENPQTKPGTTINVGVQVDNRIADERRTRSRAIAERFGAGRILRDASAGASRSNLPTVGESDDE